MNRRMKVDFVHIIMCLGFIILVSSIFSNSGMASIAFNITFLVLFLFFLQHLYRNDETLLLLVLILLLAASNVLLNLLLNDGILSFEYIKKLLMFASTLIFMYVITIIPINVRKFRFVTIISIAIGGMFLYAYFILNIRTSVGISKTYLTMNFSNPNLLGMWLLLITLFTFLAQFLVKHWVAHIVLGIESLLLVYLIDLTGSRTAEICVVVFIILLLFRNNVFPKIRVQKLFIILILLLPLIFAWVYLSYFDRLSDIFSFLSSEGKGIDSRYGTWKTALSYIKQHVIIGSYYEASHGTGGFQMHNSLLDTICSYGSVVTGLMLLYVYRIINRVSYTFKTKRQIMCMICFFIIWILGISEAAFFSGGQGIYIFGCMFLYMARCDSESVLKKKNLNTRRRE